jgi:hypothetical protein
VNQGDNKYLYARISARAVRAASRGAGIAASGSRSARGAAAGGAFQESGEFTLETGVWSIEKFAAWDNDNVEARSGLAASEQLAGETLGAIANHGAANFSRRRNAETCRLARIMSDEHGHEPPVQLDALVVSQLEVGSPPDVLGRPERRQWLSARRKPSIASAPLRGGA